MTDRELLELAAKAEGRELGYWCSTNNAFWCGEYWNPLTDDGDALRLAVKLKLLRTENNKNLDALIREEQRHHLRDAATRRAIVRAAAEIGRMK